MKTQSPIFGNKASVSKALAFGVSALAVMITSASATITFDLRASSADATLGVIGGNGKQVNVIPGRTGNVTLQVWAQVTNTAPTSTVFGVQAVLGSIVSSNVTGNLTGTLSASAPLTPFNNQSTPGAVAELSSPADAVTDVGGSGTTVTTNFIKFRKDPTSGGSQVGGTTFFASNEAPDGATFRAITNGFEFLLGTSTLSISNFSTGGGSLNWLIPAFTTPANKGQIAIWTDGDGQANTGNPQFAEMGVGSPILIAVPEPSAFGMVLLGAMGIAGFRRMGARRF